MIPKDFPYLDILDHPRHISQKHPHMSRVNRAAQFSPFAALIGHEDLIEETIRQREERIQQGEDDYILEFQVVREEDY